ncbi:AAA family ATPase, partial [Paenibacillus sp. GCM10023250]|uniref:AAA family ATPase n=1 Tax=Paenibacillus sp. GCM10023250 TaxID=3252648 RepID=UPI0036214563
MKLRELHVEGFGKLSGLACDLDAPMTVVYGPNEAGKSTMLGFVRAMLYGFANRGSLTERQEPVNGGRHGGRLTFDDGAGRTYVAERYGSAPGKVLVREQEAVGGGLDVTLSQAQWERQYLGGVAERIFRELFAITLTELQAIGMLEGDELGRQLYHAGWSGGGAIAGAEKRLQGELDELFRPRGSNQRMNKLLKALEEKENELRRLEDGIDAFNAATAGIAEAEAALAEAERAIGPLRERSVLLARAAELRERWLTRSALQRERETLADTPRFAADARIRWEALAAELRRAGEERREAEKQAAMLEARLERLVFDAELLARKTDIESLLLSAEQIAAARQSASELQAEAAEHGDAARGLLRRISPWWTEAELIGFQAGVAEREAVRVHRAALQAAEKALGLADAEHRATSEREQEAAAQLDEARSESNDAAGFSPNEADGGWSAEAGGEALAAIFRLRPQTAEALRHAARGFEDAWRELELAELRERHEAKAAGTDARAGRLGGGIAGGGALAYGAAAALLAAGAAALAAVGQS